MKSMTTEDFGRFPRAPDGCRHEFVSGRVISRPLRTWECGEITGNIAFAIKTWLQTNPIGEVAIGAGVIIERNPDTVRAPDVGFLRRARIPSGDRLNRYIEGAPDLCVEVLSEVDSSEAFVDRLVDYLRSGAQVVWLVRAAERTVTEFRESSEGASLGSAEFIDGGDVLPGFTCPVADFFK